MLLLTNKFEPLISHTCSVVPESSSGTLGVPLTSLAVLGVLGDLLR